MAEEVGFILTIRANQNPDGTLAGYAVQSEDYGLGKEAVLTLARNWLRMVEDTYHEKFKGKPD
jgi:hypothetical protein